MDYLILVINPGSMSTKLGLYKNETELHRQTVQHPQQELDKYPRILDQVPMRMELILQALEEWNCPVESLSAVMGRGGLFPPMHTGGYLVNQRMIDMICGDEISPHASNIGALLAQRIAEMAGVKAYVYDAVSAGDLTEIAKITGMPEIERKSFYHVLNSRAAAIRYAQSLGKRYDELNLIVVHMGGGITLGAHQKGKIIDTAADDSGPFGPERAGSLPILDIIDLCYSGAYTKKEMVRKVRGEGGLRAYLGTSDGREMAKMVERGDERATLLLRAQAYQVAKGIGLTSTVLYGDVDAIILTGGFAHLAFLTQEIAARVKFIAPVEVMPGEFELEALAMGGLRILRGQEQVYTF